MKKLALAACLLGSVVALSACETHGSMDTTERTTSGTMTMERAVTK